MNRAGRNARAHQVPAEWLDFVFGKRFLELCLQCVAVPEPALAGCEARVGGDVLPADELAKLAELSVVGDREKISPSPALNLSYGQMFVGAPSSRGARPEWNQLAACGTRRLRPASNSVASTR